MESSAYVIDSSVFVAFYYEGDALHEKALALLDHLKSKTLIIHPFVIQETATVLTYKLGHEVAKRFLMDISTSAKVIISSVEVKSDIEEFIDFRKKLSFTDVSLISLAKKLAVPLATFDEQMLKV